MSGEVFAGILIPLLGTAAGAGCVFFMRKSLSGSLEKALLGFASGVMVAASVWSLLIPAMDMAENMGKFAWVPAAAGFLLGIVFLMIMDKAVPHLHLNAEQPEGPRSSLSKTMMMVMAVVLHNIPEGMAVGVVFAGVLTGENDMTLAAAMVLALGIAIQNFPEGAIISLPLRGAGLSRRKSFLYGLLSGVVEPLAALVTILLTGVITPALPYLLAFAAGAMLFVVVEELIPESSAGEHSNLGTVGFAAGFVIMMILDVALG
ncbi:MAG TPA: ZIP family metal transporter [Candidatus Scatomonas pullistercoris]|uniref:ZIP family metal transporter n=1 Tax=Candidatus Scatomonas pullistercoris TaxID=2840920 RepID=A0A9D1P103_9FIRM|nr:ZIP family metal transporter [Candidatus Scatomonas pullistercoris]